MWVQSHCILSRIRMNYQAATQILLEASATADICDQTTSAGYADHAKLASGHRETA